MSDIRLSQNPGIGGLNELTTIEETMVQGLAALDYAAGTIIYHNGTGFVALPIGTDGQVLTVNDTATAVGWEAAGGISDPELSAIAGLTSAANKIPMFSGSGTAVLIDFKDEDNMASDSATAVASQQSVKAYVDGILAANDAMTFEGVIDASANPNYPAGDSGHAYKISVAGKIGGASGINVEIGDMIICTTDSSVSGTQAAVGANWVIVQSNIDGAVTGQTSSVDGEIALFSGTSGKLIKRSTDTGVLRADSGVISVDTSVVTTNGTQTLTNKRVTKRVVTVTANAEPTINTDNTDVVSITGQNTAITSMTTNLSGTPEAGDMIMFQITDNGTARAITWGASFASTTTILPTTTVISTMLRVLFQRNNANTVWDCIAKT